MTPEQPPSADSANPGALPVGTRLGEYELRSVIGVGGFGIVYLAFDHALEREVAIKEYMPASLAMRSHSVQVAPLSRSVTENFEAGLRSFVNEGRMLARFDSPSLLKVYRYWEANGTAYITMPLYRGRTLKEVRAAMAAPPDEAAARALLLPLLSAVGLLHRESIYHRDIAPDNILIEAGNRPVLLDFGAARRVIGEKSQALTAMLKPAYAPIEQYGETAGVKQGAWTDLYALGATLHFYLLGQAPPPSTTRAVQDEMQPLAERSLPGCSKAFLHTVDWMLAPRPADRPQGVAELVEVLEGRAEPPARSPGVAAPPPADAAQRTQVPAPPPPPAAAPLGVDIPIDLPSPPPPVAAAPSAALASPAAERRALPITAAVGLLAVAAWWLWPRPPAPPAPAPPPLVQMPAPRTEPAPPPQVPAVPVGIEAASAAVAVLPAAPAASARRPKPAGPAPVAAASMLAPQPRPAEPPRAGPAEPPPAAAAVAVVAKGPRETCARRVFVALLNCMNRECAKPEHRKLEECSLYRPPDWPQRLS